MNGQSAAKPRIEEGSTTIPLGVDRKLLAVEVVRPRSVCGVKI